MYSRRTGSEQEWRWDPARVRNADRFSLPAAATTLHQSQELIGLSGQWNNCRLVIAADVAWADIVFEIYARFQGSSEVLVHAGTPRSGNSRIVGTTIYSEVLLVQGFPCDGFTVRAVPGAGELTTDLDTKLTLTAWGEEMPYAQKQLTSFNNNGNPIIGAGVGALIAVGRPNHLRMMLFRNLNPVGTRYVMLFDSVTLPLLGAQPQITPTRLLVGLQGSLVISDLGHSFKTGLTIGVSTTERSFTAGPSADLLFTIWTRLP